MKIQSVFIDGFKNLSNVAINLDKITALVSLNNFGKSNLLTAIDFAIDFIKGNADEKRGMMTNAHLIPMNKEMIGKDYSFSIEGTTESNGKSYVVFYSFSFKWGMSDKIKPVITKELLKIRLNEKGQQYNKYIERTTDKCVYKSSETGRCSSKIKIDDAELIINKLRAYDHLFYIDIVNKINSLRFYMENNLDAKSFYQPDPFIRKGLENMAVNTSNLPRVIFQLQNGAPEKFDLLKTVYRQLFPNVEDIIVKQFQLQSEGSTELPEDAPFLFTNAVYVLYVKMDNLAQPIEFTLMSDGAKRVFMILTKVILAKISNVSLVAIEEPENSVHPSLFRAYINIINQLMDDCKVIITSHSPYIISYMQPTWIRVGVNKTSGVAEFFSFKTNGAKKLQNDAGDLDMSIGDYLFSMLSDTESNINDYLECEIDG